LIDTSNIYKRRDKYQAIGGEKFVRAAESVMKVVVFLSIVVVRSVSKLRKPAISAHAQNYCWPHPFRGGLFPLRPRQNAPKEHQTWSVTLTL
jgi:hypothetical protein